MDQIAKKRMRSVKPYLFERLRPMLTLPNISLGFVLCCCMAIGKLESLETYMSLAMLAVILLNWKRDEFYLYSAVFLFFWEQFYVISGSTPLYRVYSYLVMIRFFMDIGRARFRPQFLPALVVFTCFCVLSAGSMSMRIGLNLLADALLAYMTLIRVREKPEMLRKLTVVFSLAALCAGCYSLMAQTVVSYETGLGAQVEIVRYYGTVGDANYAGCFYNAAIFMTLCSDAMRRWYVRVPLMGALIYFLVLTASQTGLICLAVGICIYLLLRYKLMGIPLVIGFGIGALVFVYALVYVPAVANFGPLATLSNRISESLMSAESGNVADLTTNRSTLWRIAWDYYIDQPWLNKLIGGNVIATIITEEYFLKAVGAVHQSYIQGILDFGLIGAAIVFGTRIIQTFSDAVTCFTEKNLQLPVDLTRCVVLCAYVFLLYAFTIDMFMDWRFLYLYFI